MMRNRREDKGTRRFELHPEYKDSGVKWLGECSAHLEVKN